MIAWFFDSQLPVQISPYHHYNCEFESRSWRSVLETTLYNNVCHWKARHLTITLNIHQHAIIIISLSFLVDSSSNYQYVYFYHNNVYYYRKYEICVKNDFPHVFSPICFVSDSLYLWYLYLFTYTGVQVDVIMILLSFNSNINEKYSWMAYHLQEILWFDLILLPIWTLDKMKSSHVIRLSPNLSLWVYMLPFLLLKNMIPKMITTTINTPTTPPITPPYRSLDEVFSGSKNIPKNYNYKR